MAALNPHISGHTLRPQAIERFGRYILSNTARVPVNHPSRIFGAPRGGGDSWRIPYASLRIRAMIIPRLGKRQMAGWHRLSQTHPGAAGSTDGNRNLNAVKGLGCASGYRIASGRPLPGSSGLYGGGLAPTSARARKEFPRPVTRFAALEHGLAALPRIPRNSCVPPFNAPRPALCGECISANLSGRAQHPNGLRALACGVAVAVRHRVPASRALRHAELGRLP